MGCAGAIRRVLTHAGRVAVGILLVAVTSCHSDSAGSSSDRAARAPSPAAPVIAVVARDAAMPPPAARASGAATLAKVGFGLAWFAPESADPAAQVRMFAAALQSHPRALVVLPGSYRSLLPYLRLAHDTGVPVIVADVPRDLANPTFVISFVSTDLTSQNAQLRRLVAGRGTAVVTGVDDRAAAQQLTAALGGNGRPTPVLVTLPGADDRSRGRQLAAALASHPAVRSVILTDEPALAAAARAGVSANGRQLIATHAGVASDELLQRGALRAVVAADPCALLSAALRVAVGAAENDAEKVLPAVLVPSRSTSVTAAGAPTCAISPS